VDSLTNHEYTLSFNDSMIQRAKIHKILNEISIKLSKSIKIYYNILKSKTVHPSPGPKWKASQSYSLLSSISKHYRRQEMKEIEFF
jgi:hypothetical protein